MKFNWEKMKGKVIHCDTEEKATELLNECNNHEWQTKAIERAWEYYKDKTCFEIKATVNDIYFCSIDYYKNEEHREVLEFEDVIIPDKPKICEILGVETNELFKLKTAGGDIPLPFEYYITDDGSFLNENDFNSPSICVDTINGKFKVVKIPKYTDEQKEAFKALKTLGFNYIARDEEGCILSYESKPHKANYDTFWTCMPEHKDYKSCEIINDIFPFIKWKDKEPFEIPEV